MYRLAYNATDSQVVVDPSGRIIAGREHGAIDDVFDEARQALDRGDLVLVKHDENVAQEGNVADTVVELNAVRRDLLDAATPTELRSLAELRGLPSDEMTPTALAAMLAPTGATLDELPVDNTDTEA